MYPLLGLKKTWISLFCPLPSKQFSPFSCPRPLLMILSEDDLPWPWYIGQVGFKNYLPSKKIYWMEIFLSPASPLDKWAWQDLFFRALLWIKLKFSVSLNSSSLEPMTWLPPPLNEYQSVAFLVVWKGQTQTVTFNNGGLIGFFRVNTSQVWV